MSRGAGVRGTVPRDAAGLASRAGGEQYTAPQSATARQ